MNQRDKDKLARIEELEWKNIGYRDRLLLLKDIITRRAACKECIIIEPFPESTAKGCLSQGESVIGSTRVSISRKPIVRWANELEEMFRKNGLIKGDLLALQECFSVHENGEIDIARMLDVAETSEPSVQLVVTEALKPVFEKCRELCEPFFVDSSWVRPYCYVCGGEPDMARIEGEDNRRILYCGLCDASWHYLRLKCPFCGNEDQSKLISLSIEGEPVYSIDACRACNRYIKVLDARMTKTVSLLEVEALLSVRLDAAARKEGFL
jgi:hypothetical protein